MECLVVYMWLIDSGSKGMQVWPFLVRLVAVIFLTSDQPGNLCVACGEDTYTRGLEHLILGIMLVDIFISCLSQPDCPFHLLCYMGIFFFIDEKKCCHPIPGC